MNIKYQNNYNYFYFPHLHKGSIVIVKKSLSEIFLEFHVSDYVDYENKLRSFNYVSLFVRLVTNTILT